jgi:DNA-binding NarL/FixJ family response regulator
VDTSDIRLLVVSPLATTLHGEWLGQPWRQIEVATTPEQVADVFAAERPRFDVVLVDLMWNTFEHEWVFDGLDVLELANRSQLAEPVVLAAQGHGFEREYLEEGRRHRSVRGMILKSDVGSLLSALRAVAGGGTYDNEYLRRHLRPRTQTLAWQFEQAPALARAAGVIAAGYGLHYNELASAMSLSTSTVEKMLKLFRTCLSERGEMSADGDLSQAAVFRWCGEHAHFILSWCRRHAAQHAMLRDQHVLFTKQPMITRLRPSS